MNEIDKAYEFYRGRGESFAEILAWYSHFGYLFSMPECLLLARPVKRDQWEQVARLEEADAWFVHYASGKGKIRQFFDFAPIKLPFVMWQRMKKGKVSPIRCVKTDLFLKHVLP